VRVGLTACCLVHILWVLSWTPGRSMLEFAHRNAERFVLIINDILDLQKTKEGGMEIEPSTVDAAALMHEAIAASSLHFQRFDLEIDVVGTDTPVVSRSDPNRFIRVLGTLLGNASKFYRQQGTVNVLSDASDEAVAVRVRNEGAGIAPDDHEKIFMRVANLSNSDLRNKGGSGLGQSIC